MLVNKTKSVEKALIRMLIERYRRYGVIGRPVSDSKTILKVNYGLQLIQILDLDENKQILHTNCWSMYVSFVCPFAASGLIPRRQQMTREFTILLGTV